jgi:hypothetical protein
MPDIVTYDFDAAHVDTCTKPVSSCRACMAAYGMTQHHKDDE